MSSDLAFNSVFHRKHADAQQPPVDPHEGAQAWARSTDLTLNPKHQHVGVRKKPASSPPGTTPPSGTVSRPARGVHGPAAMWVGPEGVPSPTWVLRVW